MPDHLESATLVDVCVNDSDSGNVAALGRRVSAAVTQYRSTLAHTDST
jgi:hypothetical protein